MFELNGINYTLDQLQSAAIENNMDFNSYLQALK